MTDSTKPLSPAEDFNSQNAAPESVTERINDENIPTPENFKKTKGSNPQEIRRQFLQHGMKNIASSTRNSNIASEGKLRPGREILNRLKFDPSYDMAGFMVGFIDHKEGLKEMSVDEWGIFGRYKLMAYIRNVKKNVIIWDKARKIDLVFGRNGG